MGRLTIEAPDLSPEQAPSKALGGAGKCAHMVVSFCKICQSKTREPQLKPWSFPGDILVVPNILGSGEGEIELENFN